MARKSSKSNASAPASSLTSLLSLPVQPNPVLTDPVIAKQLFHGNYDEPPGDRRRYDPTRKIAPPHAVVRSAIRLVHATAKPTLSFRAPNLVTLCLRRQIRREVLHALNRTNKGRGGRRRRNFWSSIKC